MLSLKSVNAKAACCEYALHWVLHPVLEFISVSPKKNERAKLRECDIYVVILRIARETRCIVYNLMESAVG